jgi:hypothetical protein
MLNFLLTPGIIPAATGETPMRLPNLLSIGLAAFGSAALAAPALAHGPHGHDGPMPPMDMRMDHRDMPPPVYGGPDGPPPYPEYPGPGHSGPRSLWQHHGGPMPGPWMPPCPDHPEPAGGPGCAPYPYYGGYPVMSYAVPMMMVPVLRQKPCPEEIVEEWVEEPAPVRRRHIPPRVKDKRVKMAPAPDKRVPDKRIPY